MIFLSAYMDYFTTPPFSFKQGDGINAHVLYFLTPVTPLPPRSIMLSAFWDLGCAAPCALKLIFFLNKYTFFYGVQEIPPV